MVAYALCWSTWKLINSSCFQDASPDKHEKPLVEWCRCYVAGSPEAGAQIQKCVLCTGEDGLVAGGNSCCD
jgi:hypothetical protein